MKKLWVVLLMVVCFGCSDSNNATGSGGSDGSTKKFSLEPTNTARDRYVCSKAGADQACYERGYEYSVSHGGCKNIDNSGTLYLTQVTCWKP